MVPKIIENKREESFVSNEKSKAGRVEEKKRGRGEKVQKKKKESVMMEEELLPLPPLPDSEKTEVLTAPPENE